MTKRGAVTTPSDAQGIAIPSRPLAQQADRAYRPGRFGPGLRHKADDITKTAQTQAVFEVLAGPDVEPALAQEHVTTVHRARAGQAGDRVDHVDDRPPGADRHQVFDALQLGPDRVAFIADRNIAARAADARIVERGRESGQRRGIKLGVRVGGQDQIAAGKSRPGIDRRAAAAARAVRDDNIDQTLGRARSAMARVASVEPSSTTIISCGRKVCRRSDVMVCPGPSPPLKVGRITLTDAGAAGAAAPDRHAPNNASESSDSV